MRSSILCLALAFLPSLIHSAPFVPKDGVLQRNRRRAVDYPVASAEVKQPRQFRKRSVNYSVVQVDGESPSSDPAPPSTVVQTITRPGAPPPRATKTITYTSVVHNSDSSDEVIIVTTTQEVPETITTTASPTGVTITSYKESTVIAEGEASTVVKYNKVFDTVTTTLPATTVTASSSTSYYDDGLWHTSYAIKSPIEARSAAPTTPCLKPTPSAVRPVNEYVPWKFEKKAITRTGYGPSPDEPRDASDPPIGAYAEKYSAYPKPADYDKRNAALSGKSSGVAVGPAYPAEKPNMSNLSLRKAPEDLKTVSWAVDKPWIDSTD